MRTFFSIDDPAYDKMRFKSFEYQAGLGSLQVIEMLHGITDESIPMDHIKGTYFNEDNLLTKRGGITFLPTWHPSRRLSYLFASKHP